MSMTHANESGVRYFGVNKNVQGRFDQGVTVPDGVHVVIQGLVDGPVTIGKGSTLSIQGFYSPAAGSSIAGGIIASGFISGDPRNLDFFGGVLIAKVDTLIESDIGTEILCDSGERRIARDGENITARSSKNCWKFVPESNDYVFVDVQEVTARNTEG